MYEFQKGDYIAFNRIIQAERPFQHRTDFSTGHAIVVPAIPEQVLPQRGQACITRIIPKPRKVDGVKYQTARAQAGSPLGIVTVILDDAVLTAKQDTLFDMAPVERNEHNVYGGDAKGIS